ncbi:aminoglycoside phosphotransferase [Mycobacterium asiaticum]|uniref:Aminoglycoside phosphotransferase n=1 Tax=Mycobacterium asiaticum TaxID=1790 RepID=A0A1A3NNH4_MYCAS|nr:phosphotransferase family protein [Mycobacterium asiaticum]OBK22895.1 aminoglycoside phosphotransferase [Mycobacterium asiaticum]
MIDIGALRSWMDAHGLGAGPVENVRAIAGGSQNIMARFERDGREYVLRRGPAHPRPYSNTAILRETQVLSALVGTDVPHAALIQACDDPSVLGGSVFYLMEPIDGFNASVELPALHAGSESVRRAMSFALVDALATLGAVDHAAVGLADFGKPEGFLQRQVPRWLAELDSYHSPSFHPQIPGVSDVADWLTAQQPTRWTPGIMHGDYHAANVMFARTGPTVAAIVDWEMATIGDPLLDLGWLLASWRLPDVEGVFGGPFARSPNLPSTAELAHRYGQQTTRDMSHLRWYTVLACFKLGILLEGTWARAHAGKASMDVGQQLHTTTLRLFERAIELIEESE